jgi:cytosolic carboxypeptidase protein 5
LFTILNNINIIILGCFIYGNVLDNVQDQIQNQLYCKLISYNTAHFEYEACLFSKEHMFRIDPGK